MSTVQYFSISHLQQANWFLYKLNPTGLADKISASIHIKSALDIQAVKNTPEYYENGSLVSLEQGGNSRSCEFIRPLHLQSSYQYSSLDVPAS